ncbi:MAG: hypothetical protein QXI91_02980 [Candidatus Bathyarchaeia archaeon]
MTLLEKIYWLRLFLGIIAALASTGFMQVVGAVSNPPQANISFFLYGFDIALLIYLFSYYILKLKFAYKVDKQQKILTTGIGVYFLAWLVFWVLLYTLMVSA